MDQHGTCTFVAQDNEILGVLTVRLSCSLGVDLKNEPHGAAEWGTNNLEYDWRLAAEELGNHIISNHPYWLVFVEGIGNGHVQDIMSTNSKFWGENLMGVRNSPVSLADNSRLVYRYVALR